MIQTDQLVITGSSHGNLEMMRNVSRSLSWDSYPVVIDRSRLGGRRLDLVLNILQQNITTLSSTVFSGQNLCHTVLVIDQKYRDARYLYKNQLNEATARDMARIDQLNRLTSQNILETYPIMMSQDCVGPDVALYIFFWEMLYGLRPEKEEIVKEWKIKEGSIHRADSLMLIAAQHEENCRRWITMIENRCHVIAEDCLHLNTESIRDERLINELQQLDIYYNALFPMNPLLVDNNTKTVSTFINSLGGVL